MFEYRKPTSFISIFSSKIKRIAKKISKMKSSSSTHFGGIPLDTNTLAGQWMTFSHMANHYRKLLNVKPRVDTGLAVGGIGGSIGNLRGSYHNLSINSKMIQSSKPGKKKKNSTNGKNASAANNDSIYNHSQTHHHQHGSRHHRDSSIYSSHPDHLNVTTSHKPKAPQSPSANDKIELTIKSPLKNGRSKKKALTSHYPEYQVVFGPSSIRSSSDAFLSDNDSCSTVSHENSRPPPDVQTPIGVTEKIRRFLNHIHQLDLTHASPSNKLSFSSKKSKRATTAQLTPTCSSSVVTAERPVSVNSNLTTSQRELRHSKCFLPYEPPSPKTPRKSASTTAPKSPKCQVSSKSTKKFVTEEEHRQFSRSAHNFSNQQQQKSPRLGRNKFSGSGGDMNMMIPEKEGNSGKRPKTRRRAESIASIGTICGSDELTAEDYPVSIKDIYSTLEHGLGDEDLLLQRIMDHNLESIKGSKKSPRRVLHEQDHNKMRGSSAATNLVKSNSVASLVPNSAMEDGGHGKHNRHKNHLQTGATSTAGGASHNGNGNNNNKDSSRDSAYGFSSGESRITTRESTPEKRSSRDGLNLVGGRSSTKSHVDFEDLNPSKDVQTSSTSLDKRHRSSKGTQRHSSRSSSTVDLRRKDSNERYITFLTELTQDIVRKGIYTNKGLKILFKSHLEQNKELDPNKLADMVERLRMDLGIPKDDSLDKIEFGYGSVSDLSSSTNYFYTPSVLSRDKLSTESVILSAKTAASSSTSGVILSSGGEAQHDPSSNPSSHPSSPSPTTIIPTSVIPEMVEAVATVRMATSTTTGFSSSGGPNTSSNRSSSTGTEGSGAGDFISVPDDSEDNYITRGGNHLKDKHGPHDVDDEDEGNVHNEVEDDELSLSETEVSQYLKVAGLDDGTMQSVMGILKS